MLFEWNQAKSERNLLERGFGFDAAALIFEGPVVEWCDIRETWGEIRIVAIAGQIVAVVYTDRGEVRRIISARKARRKERALWRLLESP